MEKATNAFLCVNDAGFRVGAPEDKKLFFDLPRKHQIIALCFARTFYIPCKTTRPYGLTSYGLKHDVQHFCGLYMTENQFKDMMLNYLGIMPVNPYAANWTFRIRKREADIARNFDWTDTVSGLTDNKRHFFDCQDAIRLTKAFQALAKNAPPCSAHSATHEIIQKLNELIHRHFKPWMKKGT